MKITKTKVRKLYLKKTDALSFILKTKISFDLILIKQTIHLLNKNQINKLLYICKKKLNTNGKIIILSLDPKKKRNSSIQFNEKKIKKITYKR